MNARGFVEAVAAIQLENTFNPYSARCERFDKPNANTKRKEMLFALMQRASDAGVDSLWIGRDLGYRGGRRTGLALTDEVNIVSHAKRWNIVANQFTQGTPVAERTAAVIWHALGHVTENVFLWNVFPLHPHEHGNPFSNRSHNALERRIGEEILAELISLVRPRRLIAVGNDALTSAMKLRGKSEVAAFRHPSYGGQPIFNAQVESFYGVRLRAPGQRELF